MNSDFTKAACCFGFATTAIVNNYAPLLFSTFQKEYSITMDRVSLLILCNFGVQILVAVLSGGIDKFGYRKAMVAAMALCVAGLFGMAALPGLFPTPLLGLMAGAALYAAGAGIFNVSVNPVIESVPSDDSDRLRSLLYSAYCWAIVIIVVGSTIFFSRQGVGNWKILTLIWASVPAVGAALFAVAPINAQRQAAGGLPVKEGGDATGLTVRQMLTRKLFVLLLILIFCAGAAEQALAQWASAFAEIGLGVPKGVGDLAGPCLFAVMEGIARVLYSMAGARLKLEKAMLACGLLCVAAYLIAALSPQAQMAFIGFGLFGFAVAICWPGAISLAVKHFPLGGAIMFAALTFAGNVGSAIGPAIVGVASEAFSSFKYAILLVIVFPMAFSAIAAYFRKK